MRAPQPTTTEPPSAPPTPAGLRGIQAQERVLRVLRAALRSGKVPHAYLFAGPSGVGKRATALALAQALNCDQEPGEGCGRCQPCDKLRRGLHPDLLRLMPEGGQVSQIKIEAVRELAPLLSYAPHEGHKRVVLVEDAECMNPSAANCLLKTLEEPPPNTHFVLCSAAPARLLATVRSRCQQLRFRPLPAAVVVGLLREREIPAHQAEIAAVLAGGSVTVAERLLGRQAAEHWLARCQQLLDASQPPSPPLSAPLRELLAVASEMASEKDRDATVATLELLRTVFHDALRMRSGRDEAAAAMPWRASPAFARHVQDETTSLLRRARTVAEAQAAIIGNANVALTVERMVMRLREC